MTGSLALILLLSGDPGRSSEPMAAELQRMARELYDAGSLDDAKRKAEAAIKEDSSVHTATARRIQLDVMLRQGSLELLDRFLVPYNALSGLTPPERAWSQRLERRLAFEQADTIPLLSAMIANLRVLQEARSELWSTEQDWLVWAETRAAVREAERLGQVETARAALAKAHALDGPPERAWAEAARFRLDVGEASQRCDWDQAARLLRTVSEGAGAGLRDWALFERGRIELRQIVAGGDTETAAARLKGMQQFAAQNQDWKDWTEGYSRWLEREIALRDKNTARASELADAVSDWRERFPGERPCGLELGAPASEVKEKKKKEKKEKEPKPERARPERPLVQRILGPPERQGWVWAGARAGAQEWREALVAVKGSAKLENQVLSDQDKTDEQLRAASGLGLGGGWTLPMGLGFEGKVSVILGTTGYPSGEGLAGLTLQRRGGWLSALGGARSYTTVNPDNVTFLCELREIQDDPHPCADADLLETRQTPARGLGAQADRAVSLALVAQLELGVRLLPEQRLSLALGGGWGRDPRATDPEQMSAALWLVGGDARVALGPRGRGLTLGVAGQWMEMDVAYFEPYLELEEREASLVVSAGWTWGAGSGLVD